VSKHGPLARILIGLGLVCVAVIALAGSIVLHGASVVVVLMVAGLAAGVAYTTRADDRAAAVEAAWRAAAATVSVVLLVAGVVVLAGGAVAALVSGLVLVTGGARWLLKTRRARHAGAGTPGAGPVTDGGDPAPEVPAAWLSTSQPPVSLLPTPALGSEWLRTTSVLSCPVGSAARQKVVWRRQEILDELERRDPAGIARWLASAVATDSDPTAFVRGDRASGSDAA
jgi:hypothetical protein